MESVYVNNLPSMAVKWSILKGGGIKENLSGADLIVFLVSRKDRIPLAVEIDDQMRICAALPASLEAGVYGLKAIYFKNAGGTQPNMAAELTGALARRMESEVQDVLMVKTANEGDCHTEDFILGISSEVNTSYGYDGMDAYELSYWRGYTTLSREEWLKKINGGTAAVTLITTIAQDWDIDIALAATQVAAAGGYIAVTAAKATRNVLKYYSDGGVTTTPETKAVTIAVKDADGNTVSGASYNSETMQVYIPANGTASRTVYVVASADSITKKVSIQQAAQAYIAISGISDTSGTLTKGDDGAFGTNETSLSFGITATGDTGNLTAEYDAAWISGVTVNKTSGVITLADNSTADRSAKITIKGVNGGEASFTIRQNGMTLEYYTPVIVALQYNEGAAGAGTIKVKTLAYQQQVMAKYTDGSVKQLSMLTSGGAVAYSGSGVDTTTGEVTVTENTGERRKVTTASVTVTMNGKTSAAMSRDVYQAGATLYIAYGVADSVPSSLSSMSIVYGAGSGAIINGTGKIFYIAIPTSKGIKSIESWLDLNDDNFDCIDAVNTGSEFGYNGVSYTIYYLQFKVSAAGNYVVNLKS